MNRLVPERHDAQARMAAERDWSQWEAQLDPSGPMAPSAFLIGDPIDIVNKVLGLSAQSRQVTAQLGRDYLDKVGILKPDDTGINNGRIPAAYGNQASEHVIQRAPKHLAFVRGRTEAIEGHMPVAPRLVLTEFQSRTASCRAA